MSGIWDNDPEAVPVEELRQYVRERCKRESIRAMAMEIGIGRTTLHKFTVGNTNPHPPVRHLLQLWYHARADRATVEKVAALAGVIEGLPEAVLHLAAGQILDVVEQAHHDAEQAVPAWVLLARNKTWRAE